MAAPGAAGMGAGASSANAGPERKAATHKARRRAQTARQAGESESVGTNLMEIPASVGFVLSLPKVYF
jgi:hypothetical protein